MATAALAVAGVSACQPPPPRAHFVVASNMDGADADPGDGVCASTDPAGTCTLRAAVEEANALGAGDVTVQAGDYSIGTIEVTGDVAIEGPTDAILTLRGSITVAEGARLRVDRVRGGVTAGFTLDVSGTLHLTRSSIIEIGTPLTIRPGASAVVQESMLTGGFSGGQGIRNHGTLLVDASVLLTLISGPADGGLLGEPGSTAQLRRTYLTRCVGVVPTSLGYNHVQNGSCGVAAIGDGGGAPYSGSDFGPPSSTSELVDAIPLGTAGCTPEATDIDGNPRGVDGNGDGIAGCDIGPFEVQPLS